jgi:hypothetical protein
MKVDEAISVFAFYSSEEKEEFLAHLMHELTIIARDTYEVGQDGLTNPQQMRRVNEVQHRVSSFLLALLRNDLKRYPDELLVRIILEHPEDNVLEQRLSNAFARLMTQRVSIS